VGLGAAGARLERDEPERLGQLLGDAIRRAQGPERQSTLVNVHVGKTDFRQGSISV
jgi:hypothetical protein